ncbi:MAG TPA: translesion DNA synthesis-associated protein ImuA [Burkholderiaceae bacterium]|nr:translesion DNA synthesis-associated protein ImuA [Burkholderiaceae bacterium]
MRAATELLSLLQSAGGAPVWRADEVEDPGGPVLASGFAELDRELPGGGWPQGQLIELLTDDAGIGELSLLAPALAQLAQSRRCTVWVLPVDASSARGAAPRAPEAQAVPYAPALATAGLDLARTIFVKPATPRESLWAVEQSLRARHLGAVVGWLPHASGDGDFRALRRLHLLAQRHQALAFVLRSTRQAQAPSPAVLRLALASCGAQLQVTLLKRRGRPLLEPITLALRPPHWDQAQDASEPVIAGAQPASDAALFDTPPLPELLDQ